MLAGISRLGKAVGVCSVMLLLLLLLLPPMKPLAIHIAALVYSWLSTPSAILTLLQCFTMHSQQFVSAHFFTQLVTSSNFTASHQLAVLVDLGPSLSLSPEQCFQRRC